MALTAPEHIRFIEQPRSAQQRRSPWDNGYCESLNSKLRDKLLSGEQFSRLDRAKVQSKQWRRHCPIDGSPMWKDYDPE